MVLADWARPIPYVRVTADTLVARGPALFYGLVVSAAATGATTVDVYDGDNASGRRVMRAGAGLDIAGAAVTDSRPFFLPAPVLCERGIFADVGANIGEATLFFLPVREEQVWPRLETPVEGAPE